MKREHCIPIAILALGIPAIWAVLWFTIGPPFDERHEPPVRNGYPTWHVDPPER